MIFLIFYESVTDGPTDGRTDGRTNPLIEMRDARVTDAKGTMSCRTERVCFRTSLRTSILPCEALQGLFEVLSGLPRPSDGLLFGLLPEVLGRPMAPWSPLRRFLGYLSSLEGC